ncbi:hypothetical protein AOQ84DRAFT_357527 [Glonium stellatum]|uniref:Uncharacterized protein n=1 Tax=Glonium stellatum TaxID=574774 RepID=A0A8E2EPC6_9PEZI|nr:hypothetical protein AOQ84DRAFT_357527 [Glonium stellatum]
MKLITLIIVIAVVIAIGSRGGTGIFISITRLLAYVPAHQVIITIIDNSTGHDCYNC